MDRPIPIAPPSFRGTRSEFITRYLEPVLPAVRDVEGLHRALVEYVRQPDALFLVRAVRGLVRGTTVETREGTYLRPTDNAPAWWWHRVLFNGVSIEAEQIGSFVAATPCHMFAVKIPTVNKAGWHVAHILGAKDGDTDWEHWSRTSAIRRFVRNIHPCNVFYVPRVDWLTVGGDARLIASVAGYYRERYRAVWSEFAELAGAPRGLGISAPDGALVIDSRVSAPIVVRTSHPPLVPPMVADPRDSSADYWPSVLRGGRALAVGELLTQHPDVDSLTRRLLDGLTTQRLVAIADALHNKCRVSDMRAAAPDNIDRQADLAWIALLLGAEKVHQRPSGWTGAASLLLVGEAAALSKVATLNIGAISRVGANIVAGPYARANLLGIR